MSKEAITVRLPKLGESIMSATVVQWFKKVGDTVSQDEPLLEVATDKVNSEIPSPIAGVITELLVSPDDLVEIEAPLVVIAPSGALVEEKQPQPSYAAKASEGESASSGFISPAVLHLIREKGIPLDELDHIPGTGRGGRVTKKDVESYLTARGRFQKGAPPKELPEGVERVPMSPMRKAIADNMTRSFYQAPHAYLVTEVDITDLMGEIKKEKEAFQKTHGAKLTLTSYMVQAIATAAKAYPHLNASLEEEAILVKKEINIGIAVSVGDGLLVPVIKSCQDKKIPDIAKAIGDLGGRARNQNLKPDEVMGGSITLTNFGMSGALIGLPIIRFPEVAIIGIGAIQKKVALHEGKVKEREVIHASLSFDHRAVDGMYAGAFLNAFQKALEKDR